MKAKKFKFMPVVIAAVAVIVVVMVVFNSVAPDYAQAYKNTNELKSYVMKINTIVVLNDNGNVKQSIIDQDVSVSDRGKSNMRYQVVTRATSTELSDGSSVEETNEYMYYNSNYYYSYPGVKYKSKVDSISANENIVGLTNVITFAPDKMYNVVTEENTYEYQVDYQDLSSYAKNVLTNAINYFEDGSFKLDDIVATATVSGDYVTERSLYIVYSDDMGREVSVEIYTSLTDTEAYISEPDESKYADITK